MKPYLILLLMALYLGGCSTTPEKPTKPTTPGNFPVDHPVETPVEVPVETPVEVPEEKKDFWVPSAVGFKAQCMHVDGVSTLEKYLKDDTTSLILELDQVELYREVVPYIENKGMALQCYMSASYEAWRGDARFYPDDAKGKKMDDWDELWGDITAPSLQDFLEKRMKRAKRYGCKAIEIDNTDISSNDSGFDVTVLENMNALKELAKRAHRNGLGIFLKNSIRMAPYLSLDFEGVNNESCARYNECDAFNSFVLKRKPVFQIEYRKRDCDSYPGHNVHYKKGYFSKKFKNCD